MRVQESRVGCAEVEVEGRFVREEGEGLRDAEITSLAGI
jgi:hypothetical protein